VSLASIKSSVLGYGLAKKEQVQFTVARLLELADAPVPPFCMGLIFERMK
jgi:Holliday junction resolvasome RuvABC endonuclease subunit